MTMTQRQMLMIAGAALMGFSAGVATQPQQQSAPPEMQISLPATQDPSLAGLKVADNAEADFNPGKLYY